MLNVDLQISNAFQQKIAFEEREMLLEDPEFRWLAQAMSGAIHCRPDGGDAGR